MLVMALPFVMTACGDDEDNTPDLTLDQTSVSINYDGTATIKASEKDCVWSTDNDFVASVDNKGTIKANHVGTAVITATKDGAKATCQVTVNATNNNFTIPVIDWGATIASVKAKVSGLQIYKETSDLLAYSTNGSYPMYVYSFGEKGLDSSSLTVSMEMNTTGALNTFLKQRYARMETLETETNMVFADGNDLTTANFIVTYSPDFDTESVSAIWTPIEHTRSGAAYVNHDAINMHKEVAREFAKTIKK